MKGNIIYKRIRTKRKWLLNQGLQKGLSIIIWIQNLNFVGNRAKGRISKPVFQENKSSQIFRKTNISYPLIRHVYQEVRNVRFSENLACFVFLKDPFWDLPFCLITDDLEDFSFPSELSSPYSKRGVKKRYNVKWVYRHCPFTKYNDSC